MAFGKATKVEIKAPNMQTAVFKIGGPLLVIHRMGVKLKNQMLQKMEKGKAGGATKDRSAKDSDQTYLDSRYVSGKGWEGFNATAIRAGMISVCRLIGATMTLAKLSIFVEQDGWDKTEPQIPLVRIYGKSVRQDDIARVETGQPYVTIRAAYHDWTANVRIRWDADQFTLADITNLLSRVGEQNGIGEGRPNSKDSVGMGWGTFRILGGAA